MVDQIVRVTATGAPRLGLPAGTLVRLTSAGVPAPGQVPVPGPAGQQRLTMTSGGIVQRGGVNYRTGGANVFQLVHNDYPSSRLMTHAQIDSLLDKAVSLRIGIVRAHTLGVNIGPTANHLVTGVTGTTTPVVAYNSSVWEVMDYAVKAASDRALYLMVPMTDELGYYHGGKRQWVNFRRPGTVSLDGNVKSANSSTQRTAENFFYSDTQIKTDFKKYLTDWLNHVNQYTGRAYKDEPAIAIVETGNELWTADDFRSWTPEIAAHIKGIAPNMLVADGMAADGSSYWASLTPPQDPIEHIMTTEALASSSVDIVGVHPYSVFTATDITTAARRAKASGKSFLVGEYPWSKDTAPGIEAAARAESNVVATAFWSLQNTEDLHNGGPGAGYGTDDASLYFPGPDSTQQAAINRLLAHDQGMEATQAAPTLTVKTLTVDVTTPGQYTATTVLTANVAQTINDLALAVRAAVNPVDNGDLDPAHKLNQSFPAGDTTLTWTGTLAAGNWNAHIAFQRVAAGVWIHDPLTRAFTVAAPATPPAGAVSNVRLNAVTMPARGWFSGASGVGADNNSTLFGDWRGDPIDAQCTWLDFPTNADTWTYGPLGTGNDGPAANFRGFLDLRIGGFTDYAASARGDYDNQFRDMIVRFQNNRTIAGVYYPSSLSLAHEFNGSWYDHAVSRAEEANFRETARRFIALRDQFAPKVMMALSPNGETTTDVRVSQCYVPGFDIYLPDRYNQNPYIGTNRNGVFQSWASAVMAGTDDNPIGIERHRLFAEQRGMAMGLVEYGCNTYEPLQQDQGNCGDDPYFIGQHFAYVQQHKGRGPGQFFCEVWFNQINKEHEKWPVFRTDAVALRGPQTAAAYRSYFQSL